MRGLAKRITPEGVLAKMSGRLHYHSCTTCRVRVYSCACRQAPKNGRCQVCRGVRRPIWEAARDPHPCCYGNCNQVIRADDLARYSLAGPGPWFQCRTCARCFGEYPKDKEPTNAA